MAKNYPNLWSKAQQWYSSGETFDWQRNQIFYRRSGSGPPMLLIHGFPTAGCDWVDIAAELEPHFSLIVPDLIDYGQSKNNTGKTYHIHDQADMLEALLEQLGIERLHLLVHDVGDTVGQEIIARHNEGSFCATVESCILLNGGILPAEHRPRAVQKQLLGPFGPLIARFMSRKKFMRVVASVFGPETRPDEASQADLWKICEGVNGRAALSRKIQYMKDRWQHEKRWVGALQQTNLRLLMINGEADPVSGGHACDAIEKQIPAMEIIRLPGIGHFPPTEAPADVSRYVLAFHEVRACGSLQSN